MNLPNIIKNSLIAMPFAALPIMAQNNVHGTITEVPDKTPAFARVTFTDLANNANKFFAYTDPATGLFNLNVPSGTFQRKIEVYQDFMFIDTLAVNADLQMDVPMIKDLGVNSAYFPNILNVFKTLTATLDALGEPTMQRFTEDDNAFPINVYPGAIPSNLQQYFDGAINDILTKSNNIVQYNEVTSDPTAGISFNYFSGNEGPCPGASGCTVYDSYFPDGSPKHTSIYVSLDVAASTYDGIFRRELMRSMPLFAYSLDPSYIMYFYASSSSTLSTDEGKVLQIMFTLPNNINMHPYQETVVTDPLPVELTSFKYKMDENIVDLEWVTATEVNNYGFDVEKYVNAWKVIGFVPGHGNANAPNNYSFIDTLNAPGKYQYRLKQRDTDGKFEYSPVLNVSLDDFIKNYQLMQNYPNPFNPSTVIRYGLPRDGFVTLKVYDILGRKVATLVNEYEAAGSYNVTFNASNLASGIYIYQLKSGDFVANKKLILMK